MTSPVRSIKGVASSYAGQFLDAWNIQRAHAEWGIFSVKTEIATKNINGEAVPIYGSTGSGKTFSVNQKPEMRKKYTNILSAANVMSVDITQNYQITNAPLENGAFLSYNKVKNPFTATIRMICDGTEKGNSSLAGQVFKLPSFLRNAAETPIEVRKSFFATLEAICADCNLYTVRTPERDYPCANVIGYQCRRETNNNLTLIIVDIKIQEVRNVLSSGWTTTRTASSSPTRSNGTIQAQPSALTGKAS